MATVADIPEISSEVPKPQSSWPAPRILVERYVEKLGESSVSLIKLIIPEIYPKEISAKFMIPKG